MAILIFLTKFLLKGNFRSKTDKSLWCVRALVVTYCVQLFRTRADRHNGILMSLLFLVTEITRSTSPDLTTVFHTWPYGKFIEIQSTLRRKKLHRTNKVPVFFGGSFNNTDNVRKSTPASFASLDGKEWKYSKFFRIIHSCILLDLQNCVLC